MNYQIECEKIIQGLQKDKNKLLLHSCCAPCSSYVLVYLRKYFRITVFFYNPNISYLEEYDKRQAEQERFIHELNSKRENGEYEISLIKNTHLSDEYYQVIKGYEAEPEGGMRCEKCFLLRLEKTARKARDEGFDYFGTTLSISPLKNAKLLNEIGNQLGKEYQVSFLFSDFKKKNGYLTSVALSKEYDLYRQDYCGCVYSKEEQDKSKKGVVTEN